MGKICDILCNGVLFGKEKGWCTDISLSVDNLWTGGAEWQKHATKIHIRQKLFLWNFLNNKPIEIEISYWQLEGDEMEREKDWLFWGICFLLRIT